MNILDRVLAGLSPGLALSRARSRAALDALMHYNAATSGARGGVFRRSGADADAASSKRDRLAWSAHDLIRNTPFAVRAQAVIANNVVGDGIIWKVTTKSATQKAELERKLKAHLDTVAIDADGRQNLYGLQRLAMAAIVESGEVLIRRRRRERSDGLPLPFQIQVMEPDFLDTTKTDVKDGLIREGIQYDAIGRRVGYWLFPEHPGAAVRLRGRAVSRFVPASEILHIYRQDRPGQMRGVTWFAPVALRFMDLDDYDDAQLMRQKIAACFAAFRVTEESDPNKAKTDAEAFTKLVPGRIQNLPPGEDIKFAAPPGVEGYDTFTRGILLGAAAAMGITYEALTGDLSRVNFSSARMGRMEMDRNVSGWQWLMLIPQMLQPLTGWILEAMEVAEGSRRARDLAIDWVPPHCMLVDPAREVPAMIEGIKGGLASWQGQVRALGFDPEDLLAELAADAAAFREAGLYLTSHLTAPEAPKKPAEKREESDNGDE